MDQSNKLPDHHDTNPRTIEWEICLSEQQLDQLQGAHETTGRVGSLQLIQ